MTMAITTHSLDSKEEEGMCMGMTTSPSPFPDPYDHHHPSPFPKTRGRGYMTMATTTHTPVSEEEERRCMGMVMSPSLSRIPVTTTTHLLSQNKRKGIYDHGHHNPLPFLRRGGRNGHGHDHFPLSRSQI